MDTKARYVKTCEGKSQAMNINLNVSDHSAQYVHFNLKNDQCFGLLHR